MLGEYGSLLGSRLIPPLDLLLRLERRGGIKGDAARIHENRIKRARRVLDADNDSDALGVFRRVVIDPDHHTAGIGLIGGCGKEARGGDVDSLADVALHPVASGGDRDTIGGDVAGPVESVYGLPFDINKRGKGLGAPDRVKDD